MSEQGVFRTKMFGGFNKKDVLDYFETVKLQVKDENAEILQKNQLLENELKTKDKKIEELLDKLNEYSSKNSTLEAKVKELLKETEKHQNLETALFEANKALAESEDYKARYDELSRKLLKIKSDLIMKDSQLKKQENQLSALRATVCLMPHLNDEKVIKTKEALAQVAEFVTDAERLATSVNQAKEKGEE